MNSGLNIVDISINDPLRKMGVMYVGQYGTSGYAIAARGYICDFIIKGIPITWTPLKFDDSELSDDNHYNIMAKAVIDKDIVDPKSIILHCTADLWPQYKKQNTKKFFNKNVIGYTVWETSALPEKWSEYINESVNEVWVPSVYNFNIFRESGVTIPIRIVPHVWLKQELPKKQYIILKTVTGDIVTHDPDVYTFYTISELNERKNVTAIIEAFCKAFTRNSKVRLILKVHYKNYQSENFEYCVKTITDIIKEYTDHAPIYLISKNMTETELMGLHSLGDCYVSMTRSEAFGLTIFDAANYGRKVIVPGHGGHIDYLGNSYTGLVSYTLEDVKGMETFSHGYYMEGHQKWANPSVDHMISLMRTVAN